MRYVGKTKQKLMRRYRNHLKDAREKVAGKWTDKTHRANWIRHVLDAGSEPEMWEVWRYATLGEVNGAEKMLIKSFRSVDTPQARLVNTTAGGDGGTTRKPSCPDEDVLALYKQGFGTKQIARQLKTCAKRVSRVVGSLPRHQMVRCVVDDLGNEFVSITAAAKAHGVSIGAISNNLRGKSASSAGRVFRYLGVG